MADLKTTLSNLHRPHILVRAARHGLSDYDRKRDLRRIAGLTGTQNTLALIETLVEQEEAVEETRKSGDAAYSITRHIELLVALMAECRLLPREMRA